MERFGKALCEVTGSPVLLYKLEKLSIWGIHYRDGNCRRAADFSFSSFY